jgi:hypothetical protein
MSDIISLVLGGAGGAFVLPVAPGVNPALPDTAPTGTDLTGEQLAAALGDMPLYGADVRLVFRWPASAAQRRDLDRHLRELSATTGATVWTPNPDDPAGGKGSHPDDSAVHKSYHPDGTTGTGRLPGEPEPPDGELTLWLDTTWPLERVVREGAPSAELYLVARPQPTGGPSVKVAPGGAVPHGDAYLLPADRLHRARLVPGDLPLVLRCTGGDADGLPRESVPWPVGAAATAYARLPRSTEPPDLLPLFQQPPPARPGLQLLTLRVEPHRAVDVAATAARLDALPAVRSRLPDLRALGAVAALPFRAFDTAVTAIADADTGGADAVWGESVQPAEYCNVRIAVANSTRER